jgi:hypothetical protein
MPIDKMPQREFNYTDDEMLQKAQVFHDVFITDENDFENLFPMFADPYKVEFQTAIDLADAQPSVSEIEAPITVITNNLNNAMEPGRKALQRLFIYADLTWNDKVKTRSLGKNDYNKARGSQIKLRELLEKAHRLIDNDPQKAEIIAKGYTQADIDELETLMQTIHDLNQQQELMLSNRVNSTKARIDAMNVVWDYMSEISKASKVVFEDNPAKLSQYLLYPTSHSSLAKVQNLATQQMGANDYNLIWDPVSQASDYEVETAESTGGQPKGPWSNYATVPSSPTGFLAMPGFTYWIRVRARGTGSIVGAFSDEIVIVGT